MPDEMPQAQGAPAGPSAEPEIYVIPEKFYGAALKAHVPDVNAQKPQPTPNDLTQPKRQPVMMFVLAGFILLLLVGGAFVYFNPNLFFPKPAPAPVVTNPTPTPPAPPTSPIGTVATSTSPQSVSVNWTDTSQNETGFRIERADEQGTFIALTNVASNSSSFLDTSVQPGHAYRYRIVAVNDGGESAPSPEAPATTSELPPVVEQVKLPPAGLDTDSDGLTDLEEALFGTNPRSPDTDKDGFLDGNEVFHLYNPNGRAPGRLGEAGLVKPYSGAIGWAMQVPTPWTVTLDVADGSKATIASGHGETFKISIEDNPQNQSVLDWYLAKNPTVKREQVLEYRSKRGYEGVIGADLLTTYIPWGSQIFVFTYSIDDQPFINYRTTYSMMLNSLELKGVPQLTTPSAAAPLPFEPAATATGVIAQPVPVAPTPTPPPPPVPTPPTTTTP